MVLQSIPRQVWDRSRRSVSLFMVVVCTLVYVSVGLLVAFGAFRRGDLVAILGLSYPGIVEHFRVFQVFSAPLLHANLTHLLFNMLSLWMLGPDVERVMGKRRYILFSLLCALSAMCGFLLFDRGRGGIVLGYSGVIFGLLVAQAAYFPDKRLLLFFIFPVKMRHAALLLGAIALYLAMVPGEGGRIAHSAHLCGGLTAFGVLRLWRSRCQRLSSTHHLRHGALPPPSLEYMRRKLSRQKIPDKL